MTKPVILIVDDITANIDILKETLKDDYTLKVAINGKMALKAARSRPMPDLILLDIMMPVMDGYEVSRRLKDDIQTHSIPIIFISAKDEVTDEAMGFKLGAVDYVTKPFSPLITRSRIEAHLSLYSERKNLEYQVRKATENLQSTQLLAIRGWGRAAEFRDNDTGLHIERMSHYCRILAQSIGLSDNDVELIYRATPMHDIGKIGVPDSVLLKPGPLTDDEWTIMKKHPAIGAKIIGEHDLPLMYFARQGALSHHEKWDGGGYPMGLKGVNIPLVGRIIAIADVFDALMSKRPYKDPWSPAEVEKLIKDNAGKHFDPDLVSAFFQVKKNIFSIHDRFKEQ